MLDEQGEGEGEGDGDADDHNGYEIRGVCADGDGEKKEGDDGGDGRGGYIGEGEDRIGGCGVGGGSGPGAQPTEDDAIARAYEAESDIIAGQNWQHVVVKAKRLGSRYERQTIR